MTSASPIPTRALVSEVPRAKPYRRSRSAPKRRALHHAVGATRPDWILVVLPTTLAIKNFYAGASEFGALLVMVAFALINGLLVVAALMRQTGTRFQTQFGPLVLLFAASVIVLTRPSGIHNALLFLLVSTLAIQLARTVDARRIIASLSDGLGLYALANVLSYLAGLRSPTELERWRLSLSGDGVDRIIFPLSQSLNLPPVLAATYIAGIYFVIREPGWPRRTFRLICLVAAFVVLIGSGTRVPAVVALVLPVVAILFPAASRWVAPASAIVASCSAVVLPSIISSMQSAFNPLVSIISDRPDSRRALAALNGRDDVWERALNFWSEEVNSLFSILLGYGMQGHYKSGASLTYYELLSHFIVRDPEKVVSVHNSYLQQLFDGGVLGWIALTISLFWASIRLAGRLSDWGGYALAATMAISVILICSMTEILLHPGIVTFFIVMILVAASCQRSIVEENQPEPDRIDFHQSAKHSDSSPPVARRQSSSRPQ